MTTPDPARGERIELGPAASFSRLPAPVDVRGRTFFLTGEPGALRLLSSVCPHKGGQVAEVEDRFECPKHGWQFALEDGRCLNAPGERLAAYPVEEVDGVLHAVVPAQAASVVPQFRPPPEGLSITLHAHACLEVAFRGFTLLTDPWLDGPAFLGAWMQYPPPIVSAADLGPDAIWISHEHSDHFHPPSLKLLNRATPVYVPDFPNERLPRALAQLGFVDVRVLRFGETVELAPDFTLTCFEPASLWNDAIALMEIGGFRYLNLNDAGVNHRIAGTVAPVDLISSSFSPGASGYPITWEHVDEAGKVEIMERARAGSLEMLRTAAEVYGATYVLPFASFFTLWHPSHRRYLPLIKRNTPEDVVDAFEDEPAHVVDLLPGETWDISSGERTRERERDDLFALGALVRFAKERWDEAVFERHFPPPSTPSAEELRAYFLGLNDVPEIAFCEDLTAVVSTSEGDASIAFEVCDGRLELLEEAPAEPNVTMEFPAAVLRAVVVENLSWDEALIGYWGRLDRSPDVYHGGFWRLLQAPYYQRSLSAGGRVPGAITLETPVAELTERFGPSADRIMRRYGLYCVGCHRAPFESIGQGAAQHGLAENQVERMMRELRVRAGAAEAQRAP